MFFVRKKYVYTRHRLTHSVHRAMKKKLDNFGSKVRFEFQFMTIYCWSSFMDIRMRMKNWKPNKSLIKKIYDPNAWPVKYASKSLKTEFSHYRQLNIFCRVSCDSVINLDNKLWVIHISLSTHLFYLTLSKNSFIWLSLD